MSRLSKISILLILVLSTLLGGCSLSDKVMIKLGFRNTDFEYINENKVNKIVIQSSRDSGFRFVVTDEQGIGDIYNILSKGKVRDERVQLEPDYIFEIHTGDDVKKYNYVVGAGEEGKGNFYNDDKAYSVSKRLDETMIQNLSFIRKPKNFDEIYYGSILDVVEMKKNQISKKDYKVAVDISGDVDCLKYIFSIEMEEFKDDLKKIVPTIELVNKNYDKYDVIIKVKNRGYNASIFKSLITVENKKDKTLEDFYVVGNHEYKNWRVNIYTAENKPKNW